MHLPDFYFVYDWRRPERPLLFHRERSGAIQRVAAAELEPSEGSLLVHGPGTPVWDTDFLELLARIRDRGGAVLPLEAVLERCGAPRRGTLMERLGSPRVDIEDPRIEGREILERLAEMLEQLDPAEAESRDVPEQPGPLLAADVVAAPDAPGIYTFLSSEGRAVYVGKARSLRRRLASHFRGRAGEPAKRAALIAGATEVRWEVTGSDLEALLREHLALRREDPAVNVQRQAHRRARGSWRERSVALLLPSAEEGCQEVVLVSGDGRFHFERVPQSGKVPRGFWKRLTGFMEGTGKSWGPGETSLEPNLAVELAEITLSWLVRHDSGVNQIDLTREVPSPELKARFLRWIAIDSRKERVEIR